MSPELTTTIEALTTGPDQVSVDSVVHNNAKPVWDLVGPDEYGGDFTGYSRVRVQPDNKLGLHARPVMLLAEQTPKYPGHVYIENEIRSDQGLVDGKSIMQLMMLAATRGSTLAILYENIDGTDCQEFHATHVQPLFVNNFFE